MMWLSSRAMEPRNVVSLSKSPTSPWHQTRTRRYPHKSSAGDCQRIGIARALVLNPKFIVCDEPVSALDVSIQSQIPSLMPDLQRDYSLTLLFIAHNLSAVEQVVNRVAVMYCGRLVESAERDEVFRNPLHPYTQALMSAIPVPDPDSKRERIILEGDIPARFACQAAVTSKLVAGKR
jgi:ABC-type oligopeptide transport system ATPase subunit